MKTTSLVFWGCLASVLIACGGQLAPDANGSGSGGEKTNPDPNANVDPGPSVGPSGPSGSSTGSDGNISSWVAPTGPIPVGLYIDGVECTSVSPMLDYSAAPCGRTWNLDVTGTCSGFGSVHLSLASQDGVYPQLCHSVPEIYCDHPESGGVTADLAIGASQSFTWSGSQAGCSIDTGPDYDHQKLPITARGTLEDASGATHTFSYNLGSSNGAGDTDAGM